MSPPSPSGYTIHASCVAIDGRGVLISGPSGSGKSDLALRLIDRGARLVSDDYTILSVSNGRLIAGPPARISGQIEVRGIGIIEQEYDAQAPVCLFADADAEMPRLPEESRMVTLCGVDVPMMAIAALEPSAPIKIELALQRCGKSAV